jgi:hypothetical protein
MNTLIIHPQDPTTTFLEPIYSALYVITVITGGKTREEIQELVANHEHIIICGHGSPNGLFSISQFPGLGSTGYIIDQSAVNVMKNKKLTAIWCYAEQFVRNTGLTNTYFTNMFISEVEEGMLMGLTEVTEEMVEESNYCFSYNLAEHVMLAPEVIHEKMQSGAYARLAKINPVAAYNFSRLNYVK